MSKTEQSSYFAIIPAKVRYSKELSDRAKLLFGEINALANKEGFCYASNSYFAELYKCSPQAISKHIAVLEKAGFLKIEYDKTAGNIRRIWPINTPAEATQNTPPYQPTVDRPINLQFNPYQPTVEHNNIYNKDIVVFDENDATSESEEAAEFIEKVVSYLNAKTSGKYRPTTAATKKAITARKREGYCLEDFMAVIDNRAEAWLNDPKMAQYLRPSTLFAPSKFESYLNAQKLTPRANTDAALRDCELPPEVADKYAAYLNHVQSRYPALWASNTKVFSHRDYLDYLNDESVPALKFRLTKTEKRGLMLAVHEKMNSNKLLRDKYSTVHTAYILAVKQAMRQETIKV